MELAEVLTTIRQQAQGLDAETCGCVLRTPGGFKLLPGTNVHAEPAKAFEVDGVTMLKSWRSQGLAFVYHTHPHTTSTPSTSDRKGCDALGVPLLIVGMIDESVELLYPDPIWSGLLWRSWQLGRADCVSLVERYYAACLGIDLPRHAVPTPWPPRHDYFATQGEAWGFVSVPKRGDLRRHDVLAFRLAHSHPNHLGVYVGANRFIHHPRGQLSQAADLQPRWARYWVQTYRHVRLAATA